MRGRENHSLADDAERVLDGSRRGGRERFFRIPILAEGGLFRRHAQDAIDGTQVLWEGRVLSSRVKGEFA